MVMEPNERSYVRLYGRFKLVKLWAMMRWSDTQGVPALLVKYRDGEGLYGEVVKSKITGVEVQQFYVSEGAWLMGEGWLKKGFEMFVRFGKEANNENLRFYDGEAQFEPFRIPAVHGDLFGRHVDVEGLVERAQSSHSFR